MTAVLLWTEDPFSGDFREHKAREKSKSVMRAPRGPRSTYSEMAPRVLMGVHTDVHRSDVDYDEDLTAMNRNAFYIALFEMPLSYMDYHSSALLMEGACKLGQNVSENLLSSDIDVFSWRDFYEAYRDAVYLSFELMKNALSKEELAYLVFHKTRLKSAGEKPICEASLQELIEMVIKEGRTTHIDTELPRHKLWLEVKRNLRVPMTELMTMTKTEMILYLKMVRYDLDKARDFLSGFYMPSDLSPV